MKRNSTILTIIGIVATIAAIATLAVIFREQLEIFLSQLHDKYIAVREDLFSPDEYSDYADVD